VARSAGAAGVTPLLDVRDLRVSFRTEGGIVHAVDGVSFTLDAGHVLGIVGESGSGKSVSVMSIMRLIRDPNAIFEGEVIYKGRDLMKLSSRQMQGVRGNEIAMIFQDPMTSLNPVYKVGWQIEEQLNAHEKLSRRQARGRAIELLKSVGIPGAERRIDDHPHQFSGGMRQRVMIAMALACNPKLLIADEPTTALDVTIQAQILDLLAELKERLGMAIMLITHAMGVVAEVAQRVVVMYAGMVVEEASVEALFANPRHPYTQGLIRSIPRIDTAALHKVRLEQIPGTVPKLIEPAEGCRFAARCKYAVPECVAATPALREPVPGHKVRCIFDVFPPPHVPAAAAPALETAG
jgi:peptide/nickel transport system ATP-binding protein